MKTSRRAVEFIKGHEGLRLQAYRCPTGHWTIGWGHTSDARFPVHNGMKISKAKAQEMLEHDIEEAEAAIDRVLRVKLNGNQYGAVVSLVFNIGVGAFAKSSLLRALNRDQRNVSREFGMWVKGTVNGKRKTLPGLVRRRAEEAALFATPTSLEDKIVKQPPITGASEETVEARDNKLGVEQAKDKTPWKSLLGGGLMALLAPVFQLYEELRGSLGDIPYIGVILSSLVAVAVLYMVVSYMRRDDDELDPRDDGVVA